MKTDAVNFPNNISLRGGLYNAQRKFIKNLNVSDFEEKLYQQTGVACDFMGNNVIAGLTGKTIRIFKKLGLTLPETVIARRFELKHKHDVGMAYLKQKHIEFNTRFFKTLEKADYFCEKRKDIFGDNHILNVFLHEFLHIHHKNVMKRKDYYPKDIYFDFWTFRCFEEEIKEKVGFGAISNPIELYATFWAKEISASLDKNWTPKYNPFLCPQTKLSPQALDFVCSLEDVSKAIQVLQEKQH